MVCEWKVNLLTFVTHRLFFMNLRLPGLDPERNIFMITRDLAISRAHLPNFLISFSLKIRCHVK